MGLTVSVDVYQTDRKMRMILPKRICVRPSTWEVATGVFERGMYEGRRWFVVHYYSIWLRPDGHQFGDSYVAYDKNHPADREIIETHKNSITEQ